jgi:hypothetical protein
MVDPEIGKIYKLEREGDVPPVGIRQAAEASADPSDASSSLVLDIQDAKDFHHQFPIEPPPA